MGFIDWGLRAQDSGIGDGRLGLRLQVFKD